MARAPRKEDAPLGLICAIPQEFRHLHAAMRVEAEERIAGLAFTRGLLGGHAVVIAETGIGKVNAALVTTVLATHFGARAVALSGVAGGLDPELAIGDVVVARKVIQHDAGLRQGGRFLPYQAGHIPFFNPTEEFGFSPPPELLAQVEAALAGLELPELSPEAAGRAGRRPRILFGTVLTGDQFVNCEGARRELHERFGAQAVEMEGGAVAQACRRFGLPWLVVRALSDLAGAESHIDFGAFVEEVAAASALILRRLLPVL